MPGDGYAVDLLTRMLDIPSLCGKEDAVAALLVETMTALGFDACRDGAGNVVGTLHPADTTAPAGEVVMLGHMDTVPGWIRVEKRDGALYGRGAVDAKGPLATAIVAAARAASRSSADLTVIGAVQEEGPSIGARFLTHRHAPDYLVIAEPSGWDAVVLGYKGSMRFTADIAVRGGHSAGPLPSACEVAVTFWNDLVAWCAEQDDGARHDVIFSQLTPSLLAMSSANDGIEDVASLHIGLRLPPGLDPSALQPDIEALLPSGAFCFSFGDPAVRSDKRNPLVAAFLRSIRFEEGNPRFKVKTGTSDMNVVGPVWGCPMVAYGPGDSSLDHTPGEHVAIDEYLRGIRVLTHVLEDL
ncbi:MAG: acetyl-lysine deacetylase [Chloroflexi bacterium]|nr:MAG: acetyl-lysine deacetylase [Chloroflexota bacterium]